jgi:hypothetical protein
MRIPSSALGCAILIGVAVAGIVAPSSPALSQQKTAKACQEEWRANKADNQTKGITEKAYVEKCRAGGAAAQPTAAPAEQPKPTAAPAAAPPPKAAPPAKPRETIATAPAGIGSANEAQAKARCPADTVVWVNEKSKIYHFSGHKDYGNTKEGTYMCEKDATAAGDRAAKNEKHP